MPNGTATITQEMLSRLEEVDFGRLIRLEGVSADRFRRVWPDITGKMEAAGRTAILVDGGRAAQGRGAVYHALSSWTGKVSAHQEASSALRLLDYLTMAMDMGSQALDACERGTMVADAAVRLVEELSDDNDAVLFVVESERLSIGEHNILNALLRHFLVDPLADIDPSVSVSDSLGCVWCGSLPEVIELEAQVVDLGSYGEGEVRRFLNEERVVARLLDTTSGDPRRLEAIFEALPDTVEYLWTRRLAELSPRARMVADVLAVADQALEVSDLDRLVQGAVVPAVREICEAGIAVRKMSGGAVQVELASSEIGTAIRRVLDGVDKKEIHLSLAMAAANNGASDEAFVARHALAGGDVELGVRCGLPAARRLLAHGRWDGAERLLWQLEDVDSCGVEERREILELNLRLVEGYGRWQSALELANRLKSMVVQPQQGAELDRRIATYLTRLGRHDEAERQFRAALDQLEAPQSVKERVHILLGLAETIYHRGGHEEARRLTQQAREELEGVDDGSTDEPMLMLKCSDMLGKVALIEGRLEEARRFFDECATLARRQGNSAEESRAEANLGVVALQQIRLDEAARRLECALDKAHMPGGVSRVRCYLNLGIVYQRRSDFEQALKFYRQALRDAARCGDDVAYGVAAHNLATLYQDMGAFDEARQMVDYVREHSERTGVEAFTLNWVSLVEVQILLGEGQAERALELWNQVESDFGQGNKLYRVENRLRCVGACLQTGAIKRARELFEKTPQPTEHTPQTAALFRYYEAVLACRGGSDLEDWDWYAIIDQLESVRLYRSAAAARIELVRVMDLDEDRQREAAALIVERGVASLRRRAEHLPERFRKDFFEIDSYRELIEYHRRLSGENLPDELRILAADKEGPANSDRISGGVQTQRFDPEYLRWRSRYDSIVGEDPKMLQIFGLIDRVAPSETTVLLSGESGTGKELVAQAIHDQSARADEPFIKVNCAAFVEELLLSELFGHKKGAFTGAVSDRIGHFERADGGTIFLDEIGDISPKTQVALLRVLQEGTFEAVGGTETRSVDVRVVAATNRDLDQMVREGEFRLDLYYRLKGFLIEVPPLRERRDDIPRLLHHFVGQCCGEGDAPRFEDDAVQFLASYRWPGNVREMENFVRSILLFTEGDEIGRDELGHFREFFSVDDLDESLPPVDTQVVPRSEVVKELEKPVRLPTVNPEDLLVDRVIGDELSLADLKDQLELKCIERALRQTGGNITQAARLLQMKRPRLSQIVNGTPELLSIKEELVG